MKRYLLLLLCLMAPLAHGAMYKCSKDGAVAYQETPCDQGSKSLQTEVQLGSPMEGCYKPTRPSEPYELLEVRAVDKTVPNTRYRYSDPATKTVRGVRLLRVDRPDWEGATLRPASADEVSAAATAVQAGVRRGVTTDQGGYTYSRIRHLVPGVYEGKDPDTYFILFNGDIGPAKKVPCR